jgi:2'-5' RNA ligase
MKKLFLAIATHEGLEESAAQIIKKLRASADQKKMEVRWVPIENFHVTLFFLGATREEKVEEVESLIAEVAAQTAPFTLKISDIGAFPDDFKSRILWFGVQNSKALRSLQSTLTDRFSEKNYPSDKREFAPHLTIARLRNPNKTKDLMSPFARKKIAKIDIQEIVLYESVGSVPFPVYKALKKFSLTGEPVENIDESIDETYSTTE